MRFQLKQMQKTATTEWNIQISMCAAANRRQRRLAGAWKRKWQNAVYWKEWVKSTRTHTQSEWEREKAEKRHPRSFVFIIESDSCRAHHKFKSIFFAFSFYSIITLLLFFFKNSPYESQRERIRRKRRNWRRKRSRQNLGWHRAAGLNSTRYDI